MKKNNILPIAVVIPTMNRPQTLQRTLNTYFSADYLPAQIIVVDQSKSEEMQSKNKFFLTQGPKDLQINYIYQKVPSSTQARNTALKYNTQDIIVWSDDDVDVYKDTLKNVYDLFRKPQIAMIAGLNDCSKKSTNKLGYLLGTKSFFKRDIGHITKSMLGRFPEGIVKGEVSTEWAMGFFFAVRAPLLKKWGILWDENLTSYAYAEDLDFSYSYYKHAKKEQMKCIMSQKVHVKHLASKEYRIPSKKATYMYVCNRHYLSHKHGFGILGKIAMLWTNFGMLLFRLIKKQNAYDMGKAMLYCYKNHKKIERGDVNIPL